MVVFIAFVGLFFGYGAVFGLAMALNRDLRTRRLRRAMSRPPSSWLVQADSPGAVRAMDRFAQVICWVMVAVGTFGFVTIVIWIATGV